MSNNRASFHLCGHENLIKQQKDSKYENDCRLVTDLYERPSYSLWVKKGLDGTSSQNRKVN